jgi:hypothetical protein
VFQNLSNLSAVIQQIYLFQHHLVSATHKVHPRTGREGPEVEWSYSYTLSVTSALDWGGWTTLHIGCCTPGKEIRYTFYRRLGGPQGQSGQVRKISPPPGFDPRTIQPVASHYAD